MKRILKRLSLIALAILFLSGCATSDYRYREPNYEATIVPGAVLHGLRIAPEVEDKILALDPERITESDIKEALARGPAPRIINLHGGVPIVYLAVESFSQFLIDMGYPESKIRNPQDGSFSYSPYKNSAEIAGIIAWYYEKEGMPLMVIGHSAGGVQTVKVLHQLAGTFSDRVAVWNPLTEESERRYSIVDPITGKDRPVVGVRVGYAGVVGSGGLARLLPHYWGMLRLLRSIPDSVEHFTGGTIGVDLIGGDFFGLVPPANRYSANGKAHVRNVQLPASYSHVTVPVAAHLSKDLKIRDWINAYRPSEKPELDAEFEGSTSNILWIADVWHSIKKQWCLEAQRLIRAKRKMANGQ
jgi:hypothetical protein